MAGVARLLRNENSTLAQPDTELCRLQSRKP
jgi:hypothetical protein